MGDDITIDGASIAPMEFCTLWAPGAVRWFEGRLQQEWVREVWNADDRYADRKCTEREWRDVPTEGDPA